MSYASNSTSLSPAPGRPPKKSSLIGSGNLVWQGMFWTLTLVVAIGSWRWMLGGVALQMEQMLYHEQLRPLVLYTHIICAPVSLVLVPFQLWKGLRNRRPTVHRLLGRLYGGSILLASTSGLWLAITTEAGAYAAWGFGLLAVAWFITTSMGVGLAVRRDFTGHRRWMIRSVAMTMAAVTLRVYIIPTEVMDFGSPDTYQAIAWLCWVPNLIAAELYLRRLKMRKERPQRVAAERILGPEEFDGSGRSNRELSKSFARRQADKRESAYDTVRDVKPTSDDHPEVLGPTAECVPASCPSLPYNR